MWSYIIQRGPHASSHLIVLSQWTEESPCILVDLYNYASTRRSSSVMPTCTPCGEDEEGFTFWTGNRSIASLQSCWLCSALRRMQRGLHQVEVVTLCTALWIAEDSSLLTPLPLSLFVCLIPPSNSFLWWLVCVHHQCLCSKFISLKIAGKHVMVEAALLMVSFNN